MAVIILLASIVLLLLLITVLKFPAFIALIIASLFAGIADGMNLQTIISSIINGMGSTLGSVILLLGLGVMFGSLLTETGAIQRISATLIKYFGEKKVKIAMIITGFVVGIAMFYNAGFLILIPLVFSVASYTKQSVVYITIAMASALSVTHGFLPPHPAPTAIAVIFKADITKVLLYGFMVAVPAIFIAGFLFPEFIKKIKANPPQAFISSSQFEANELPSFALSFFIALIPFLLMAISAITSLCSSQNNSLINFTSFIGEPNIAMLIAVLCALIFLGLMYKRKMKMLIDKASTSLNAVTMLILIIAAGGAFKQILVDSGTATTIANYFQHSTLSPLFLGWLVATVLRISVGSATVAGLTAAGIVAPLILVSHVNPALMVLSVGAGSLMCSHVNDTGFWMFKEYLGLSVGDTFRTWSVMETIIGIVGLIGVLILHLFV